MWNVYAIARGAHVLSVVLWIGGVAFVTLVLIPAIRRDLPLTEQLAFFERIEHRFAHQARVWVALALASGWWMLELTGGWGRALHSGWLALMVAAWVPFALMLFVLEPLFVHRVLRQRAATDPAGAMALLQRLHVALLVLSLAAVLAGAVGAHGGWSF
jgi:uncharacterized membrane protein